MNNNSYPDWVLKHKTKGVYVLKKKDAYYLYRAHSQRIKGTNKVKRVFDGYIGRVTEEDGFIPVKDKITGDIKVFDFGLTVFCYSLCFDIYKGFKSSHRTFADTIFASAIFQALNFDISCFSMDALSLLLPKFSIKHLSKTDIITQIDRCTSMILYYLEHKVDADDLILIKKLFPSIHIVYVNDSYRVSSFDSQVQNLLDKYCVEVSHYVKSF